MFDQCSHTVQKIFKTELPLLQKQPSQYTWLSIQKPVGDTPKDFKGLKATNRRQDNQTGVLHQVAQHPIYHVYLYKRCPCPSSSMQDLEEQGTACRGGRSTHPSKPPTPSSKGQLKHVGNNNFTDSLSRALNKGSANGRPVLYHCTTTFQR